MAFFAANRSLQLSLELQRCCLLISTRCHTFLVASAAKRGYRPSGPVRYIPKDYNQVEKAGKIPPLESVGKKEADFVEKRVVKSRRDDHKLPQNFDGRDYQNNLLDERTFRSGDCFEQAEEYAELEDAGEVSDSNGRAKRWCGSSGPVRHVPKDYIQVEKTGKIPPLESLGKKEESLLEKRVIKGRSNDHKLPQRIDDKGYQSNLLDDKTFRSSDFFEQNEEYSELEDAGEISDSHGNKVAEGFERVSSGIWKEVEQTAIQLLAVRAFTVVELQKKLRGKKYPLNIVESVISNIQHRGLINDGIYAESFSRSRWLSSTWGPRRIKQALIQKGVSGEIANDATKQVFGGDDPNCEDNNLQHGMSKLSMDRLFDQASKQWRRGQETTLENRKARIVRWLQYRGFNWGVTSVILKKLETEYPPGE